MQIHVRSPPPHCISQCLEYTPRLPSGFTLRCRCGRPTTERTPALQLRSRDAGKSQDEALNGLRHAAAVVVSHHQLRRLLDPLHRIAHRHPHPCTRHHAQVVAAIADGHQVAGGHAPVLQQLLHGPPLVPPARHHLCRQKEVTPCNRGHVGGYGSELSSNAPATLRVSQQQAAAYLVSRQPHAPTPLAKQTPAPSLPPTSPPTQHVWHRLHRLRLRALQRRAPVRLEVPIHHLGPRHEQQLAQRRAPHHLVYRSHRGQGLVVPEGTAAEGQGSWSSKPMSPSSTAHGAGRYGGDTQAQAAGPPAHTLTPLHSSRCPASSTHLACSSCSSGCILCVTHSSPRKPHTGTSWAAENSNAARATSAGSWPPAISSPPRPYAARPAHGTHGQARARAAPGCGPQRITPATAMHAGGRQPGSCLPCTPPASTHLAGRCRARGC